ncbi:MAG TPA: helix-turn-helix domain-containing protein [Streptosporangiaceae bacterium]|jgi:transcriptional regulator with XRE-family HTH domain
MKLSDLRSADSVDQEDMADDPDYRREYLETSFANQVAIQVIRWRTEHGLTQANLAEMLGMRQPNIARLEAGEHTPSLDTLSRLSSGLGRRFDIGIDPENGIHLDEFRPRREPGAAGSPERVTATTGSAQVPGAPAIAEIARKAVLDLDEPTYAAMREAVVKLLSRLGQRRPVDASGTSGRPVNIDALFRDPAGGLIVFLAGFPGHRVNYLEVGPRSSGAEPAPASRTE